jgi:tyrosyl-tRNA synthetase
MPPQSILTMPILPGTDGVRRMSKSLGNYVGVTDPPDEMFGKLMSIPDDVMSQYYLLLLYEHLDADRHPGEAKRELARRLVGRFHGDEAAKEAEGRFDQVHVRREVPEDIPEVGVEAGEAGEVHLPALIADAFGVSTSEARRLLGQGGVKVDGEAVDGGRLDMPIADLDGKVLQVGKRRFARVVEGSS